MAFCRQTGLLAPTQSADHLYGRDQVGHRSRSVELPPENLAGRELEAAMQLIAECWKNLGWRSMLNGLTRTALISLFSAIQWIRTSRALASVSGIGGRCCARLANCQPQQRLNLPPRSCQGDGIAPSVAGAQRCSATSWWARPRCPPSSTLRICGRSMANCSSSPSRLAKPQREAAAAALQSSLPDLGAELSALGRFELSMRRHQPRRYRHAER